MHDTPHDIITTLGPLNSDIQSHVWRLLTADPSSSFLRASRDVYTQFAPNLYRHVVLDKWNAMRFFRGLGLSEDEACPLSQAEHASLVYPWRTCRVIRSTATLSLPTVPHRSPFIHKIRLLRHCQSLTLVDVQAAVWTLRASTKFDRLGLYSKGHHRLFPNLASIHFGQSLIYYANKDARGSVGEGQFCVDWSDTGTKDEHLIPGTRMNALQVFKGLAKEFSGNLSVQCECEVCEAAKEGPDGRHLTFDLSESEPLSNEVLTFIMGVSQWCSTVKMYNIDPVDLFQPDVRWSPSTCPGMAARKIVLYLKHEAWMCHTHEESVLNFVEREFKIVRDEPAVIFAERHFKERKFLANTPESIEIISSSLRGSTLAKTIIRELPFGHLIVDSGMLSVRVPGELEMQHKSTCD
ncbi:hypothetical protein IAR50_004475 [Cryptococcus sp. DSM 104548]